MQGKVMSEHAATPHSDVGIDVCKDWLDVHILPSDTVLRVANTKKGHKQLMAAFKGLSVRRIVVEATAKYHRSVHHTLHDAGFKVSVVHPLRARLFAEALGTLAKTDKVDARMLAVYGAMAQLQATEPLPQTLENLREIVRARDGIMATKVALENQLGTATLPSVKKLISMQIASAVRAAGALEAHAMAVVNADPVLARRFEIVDSIPGIGGVTSLCM